MLSESEFERWVAPQEPGQAAVSEAIRGALLSGAPTLTEAINTGRWLNGYLFYSAGDGTMVHALGAIGRRSVAFHSMPWYGSPGLRATYGAAMTPFIAGKSCFHFSAVGGLPLAAIAGIVAATAPFLATRDGRPAARDYRRHASS